MSRIKEYDLTPVIDNFLNLLSNVDFPIIFLFSLFLVGIQIFFHKIKKIQVDKQYNIPFEIFTLFVMVIFGISLYIEGSVVLKILLHIAEIGVTLVGFAVAGTADILFDGYNASVFQSIKTFIMYLIIMAVIGISFYFRDRKDKNNVK